MDNRSPYKTAADLGIEQWEHDGLVALVGPLSRNELRLDMQNPAHACGTVACIGGWLALRAGKRAHDYVFSRDHDGDVPALGQLYWPRYEDGASHTAAYQAKATQAACAIVNFLTLGDPCWDDVMRTP